VQSHVLICYTCTGRVFEFDCLYVFVYFDVKRYRSCRFSNWKLMMIYMCVVRLQHPPIITNGPHNQTVHVGDTVRFTCDLLSDPEYHLQWLKTLDEDIVVNNETRNFIVLHVSVAT